MKTTQEKLQYIKSKVVEACPELTLLDLELENNTKWELPVRLSHILRTIEIEKDSKVDYWSVDTSGNIYGTVEVDPVELNNFYPVVDHFVKHIPGARWNLEKDNLNNQSKATIDLIYQFIK